MKFLSYRVLSFSDAGQVAEILSLSQDEDGFFQESDHKFDPIGTMIDGVYVAGCCQGPKDIPDTVAQACGAAGKVLALISKREAETEMKAVAVGSDE